MAYDALENFKQLNTILHEEKDFFKRGQVETIEFKTSDVFVEKLLARIKQAEGKFLKARSKFGDAYKTGYVDPLLKNLKGIVQKLTTTNPSDKYDPVLKYVFLTQIVNAALQPGENSTASALRPIQNFVDDMYLSFLTARTGLPRDHKIPPLVSLVDWLPSNLSNKPPMPSMLELEQLQDLLGKDLAAGFTAGVVLLPPGYKDRPLLWGVLGHEIGGHYALTSDPKDKLLRHLQQAIYIVIQQKFPSFPVLAPLWSYWTEEAAADACSVLNLGPTGIGALAFFTAIRIMSGYAEKKVLESLSLTPEDTEVDDHHVPALVPDVICGAIEGLKLQQASEIGVPQIKKIADHYIGDSEHVKFQPGVWVEDFMKKNKVQLPDKLPLGVVQKSARLVGQIVIRLPLPELGGKALGELIKWKDDDEKKARGVADQLIEQLTPQDPCATVTIDQDKVEKRHLLAGGTLAVMRHPNPDFYRSINAALIKEFAKN